MVATLARLSTVRRGLAMLLAVALLTVGGLCARAAEPIKIGLLLTYVGPSAIFARYEDKGARMRIDEVNKAGGIDGRPIELINYDTEGKPDRGGTLFRRLAQDDKVPAVIGPDSILVLLGMSAIPGEMKVPSVAAPGSYELIAPKDRPFVVSAWASPGFSMSLVLAYLRDKLNVKRIGMLTTADKVGEINADEVASIGKMLGVELVQVAAQPVSDRDLLPSLRKLAAVQPLIEGLFIFGSGPFGTIAMNQSELAGIKVPLAYMGGNVIPELIKDLTPEAGARTYLAVARAAVADTLPKTDPYYATIDKFTRDYTARYNEAPTLPSAVGYDMAQTVVDALQAVGPDPLKIQDYISNKQKNLLGVQGVRFNRTPADGYGTDPRDNVVISIADGKFVFKGYVKDSFDHLGITEDAIHEQLVKFDMILK